MNAALQLDVDPDACHSSSRLAAPLVFCAIQILDLAPQPTCSSPRRHVHPTNRLVLQTVIYKPDHFIHHPTRDFMTHALEDHILQHQPGSSKPASLPADGLQPV